MSLSTVKYAHHHRARDHIPKKFRANNHQHHQEQVRSGGGFDNREQTYFRELLKLEQRAQDFHKTSANASWSYNQHSRPIHEQTHGIHETDSAGRMGVSGKPFYLCTPGHAKSDIISHHQKQASVQTADGVPKWCSWPSAGIQVGDRGFGTNKTTKVLANSRSTPSLTFVATRGSLPRANTPTRYIPPPSINAQGYKLRPRTAPRRMQTRSLSSSPFMPMARQNITAWPAAGNAGNNAMSPNQGPLAPRNLIGHFEHPAFVDTTRRYAKGGPRAYNANLRSPAAGNVISHSDRSSLFLY